MPGTNAGTGEPIYFRCAKERKEPDGLPGRHLELHRVTRTGHSRPYPRQGQGIRTMKTAWEYKCSCGHVGWSAHRDIMRYPVKETIG